MFIVAGLRTGLETWANKHRIHKLLRRRQVPSISSRIISRCSPTVPQYKAKLLASSKTENNVIYMKLRRHLDAHVGDAGQSLLSHLLNGSHSEAIGAATKPERLDKLTLHVRKRETRKAGEKAEGGGGQCSTLVWFIDCELSDLRRDSEKYTKCYHTPTWWLYRRCFHQCSSSLSHGSPWTAGDGLCVTPCGDVGEKGEGEGRGGKGREEREGEGERRGGRGGGGTGEGRRGERVESLLSSCFTGQSDHLSCSLKVGGGCRNGLACN